MAVVKGTKDRKFQVIKGEKDTRGIRCPKCKNMAFQMPNGKGGMNYECAFCGNKFNFMRL